MKAFLVLLISLLLCGIGANGRYLRSVTESSENELDQFSPNNEALEKTAEASVAAPELVDPTPEECSDITLGATVQFFEGTNLQNITTSNAFECCGACQGLSGCTSWIHNRENGLCALYNVARATVTTNSESEFDIGGFPREEDERSLSRALNISDRSSIALGASIVIEAPVSECSIILGVTYPTGDVLAAGNTGSGSFCCELCRSSRNCNSWFYNHRNNRCTMNRNIPTPLNRESSRFQGGSVLG